MTEVAATAHVRTLGRYDAEALMNLADRDTVANVFVRHRLEASRHDHRWLGAQMWGYYVAGELVSACHVGANIVPVQATAEAVSAFADRLQRMDGSSRSIVGPAEPVRQMAEQLRTTWGTPRSERLCQPLLAMDTDSHVHGDSRLRPTTIGELDIMYPACVDMFTEEVGVRPDAADGGAYRARVAQLISRGWSLAIIDRDRVLFKAEIGSATREACQLQGVWVNPEVRGTGIAIPAMSAVVAHARRLVAPTVSLYVNDFNTLARHVYQRVGFTSRGTFASVMW